ncbi:glycosyl transferase family 1 [Croceibacterium mercuriale]|uniref:Glycosyl transferase family 1 n=1 Tax=Croceibacterium mercuriale TaxID=1572751 RepID=A0A0B2C2B3_9SPHN|nr:glycosyltransferase family 1 protein [Croceibacterium mercuriale]KHL26407.1 glycosyl transferase family 1 [Croceibacterium mercuriale]
MDMASLRVALFSGNYNYVRDGANQALNRLVDYLLRQGAAVRVYAPTVPQPAFEPKGDLVSVPSTAFPGRGEYRFPLGLSAAVRRDLAAFDPTIVHVASPDIACQQAVRWARRRRLPVLASVHTRFETYPRYYHLGFIEPVVESLLRRFYNRCDALVAPSEGMAQVLRDQAMNGDIALWQRGVDRAIFHPGARDPAWRHAQGLADDEVAVGFLGRLVMEKGLDVFADTLAEIRQRGIAARVLVVGEGPAHGWLAEHLPADTIFAGFQKGPDLGRAVAAMDLLLNPSITETFGNVTLEAMACGVPVVGADATGSNSLIVPGETGVLVQPGDVAGFADAVGRLVTDRQLRTRMGIAGERRSAVYGWDAINGAVVDTYARLIAAHRGPVRRAA